MVVKYYPEKNLKQYLHHPGVSSIALVFPLSSTSVIQTSETSPWVPWKHSTDTTSPVHVGNEMQLKKVFRGLLTVLIFVELL